MTESNNDELSYRDKEVLYNLLEMKGYYKRTFEEEKIFERLKEDLER